jgi:hypothetical protein
MKKGAAIPTPEYHTCPPARLGEQLRSALISTLPVEKRHFVAADDLVAFLSEGPDRVSREESAPRNAAKCSTVHRRAATTSWARSCPISARERHKVAEFGSTFQGRFVSIRYFPYATIGRYWARGRSRMDAAPSPKLEGERRLCSRERIDSRLRDLLRESEISTCSEKRTRHAPSFDAHQTCAGAVHGPRPHPSASHEPGWPKLLV